MRFPKLTGALLGLSLACGAAVPAQTAETLDHIVAIVGDGIILNSELNTAIVELRRRLGAEVDQVPEDVLRSQVLEQLILKRLQTQRAERAGIRVSDAELNDAIERLASQNGMSVPQFMASARNEGIDPNQMRERLREQLLLNKIRQREISSRVVVTEEDVDRYLESQSRRVQQNREYRIRHILVAVSDDANSDVTKAAQQRIEKLRQRAMAGESFSDLAIAHSDGQKALRGGDLGWIPGAYMPTQFSDIVPRLEEGEVSKVFRGTSGFHLIKLEDSRLAGTDSSGSEKVMVEEVKARHILLRPNEIRDNERTQAEIETLRQRLEAGDDFTDLAREYSDDSGSAGQGGELGWIQPGSYPPKFASRLEQLKPGEVSQPFETSDGWHLVQVLDRRERDKTEERRRQRARQALASQKIDEETELYLRRLRDEAYVDIRMEDYQAPGSG